MYWPHAFTSNQHLVLNPFRTHLSRTFVFSLSWFDRRSATSVGRSPLGTATSHWTAREVTTVLIPLLFLLHTLARLLRAVVTE